MLGSLQKGRRCCLPPIYLADSFVGLPLVCSVSEIQTCCLTFEAAFLAGVVVSCRIITVSPMSVDLDLVPLPGRPFPCHCLWQQSWTVAA